MLRVFSDVLEESDCAPEVQSIMKEYAISLTRVPRFGTVVLFMSRDERALVQGVWNVLGADDTSDTVAQAKIAWRVG